MEAPNLTTPDRIMTREEYMRLVPGVFAFMQELIHAKNADYGGGSGDPFANFRQSIQENVDPIRGLRLRIGDKEQRIRSFLATGQLKVKSESVYDAVLDRIGYSLLELGMLIERNEDWHYFEKMAQKAEEA